MHPCRMNRWRHKLDSNLPGDLRQISEWIYRAEEVLARGLNFDPSTLKPEENLQRFNHLHEEHAVSILLDLSSFHYFIKYIFVFIIRLYLLIKI